MDTDASDKDVDTGAKDRRTMADADAPDRDVDTGAKGRRTMADTDAPDRDVDTDAKDRRTMAGSGLANGHHPITIDPTLDRLWQRGKAYLGVDYPIMGGAMTWISEAGLVSAISNAGAFGVIAAGAQTPTQLDGQIRATRARTSHPFGVNLIIMHEQIDDLMAVCIDQRVSHVILAGGIAKRRQVGRLRDAGCHVMGFIPTVSLGRKLLDWGVDGLIIEGMEAGGHTGAVSTTVLAQEILPEMENAIVFVAGGIGRGEGMVSYLEMGASGCQIGTLFACARESIAHPSFKKELVRAKARDAKLSIQLDHRFPVIPVRSIHNRASRLFLDIQRKAAKQVDQGEISRHQAQMTIEHFWAGALRRAVIDGDVETGSLMAGQSVGMVRDVETVTTIIARLIGEAGMSLKKRRN